MSNQCMRHLSASPLPREGLLLSILGGWVPSGVLFFQLFACWKGAMTKLISRQARVWQSCIPPHMNSLPSRYIYILSLIPLLTNSLSSSISDHLLPTLTHFSYTAVANPVLSHSCTQLYYLWGDPLLKHRGWGGAALYAKLSMWELQHRKLF